MTVYVIESGYYEERGVDGVASSPEAAVALLKSRCKPPHIVKWGELRRDVTEFLDGTKRDNGCWEVSAHYEDLGYDCTYSITPYGLDDDPVAAAPEVENVDGVVVI